MKQIVLDAIERYQHERPDLFDWDTEPGQIIYHRERERFVRRIIENIRDTHQYDAWFGTWEPETHIAIKSLDGNNEFSEAYSIISSQRRLQRMHAYTCYPAEFSDGLEL